MYHCNIEYNDALLKDAYTGLHALVSLRKSILKGHLEMSGYVDTTDTRLYDDISLIIDSQHDIISKINSCGEKEVNA